MAQIHELNTESNVGVGLDFVTDNGESTGKVGFAALAGGVLEKYEETELAGQRRSVKRAIDDLAQQVDDAVESIKTKAEQTDLETLQGGIDANLTELKSKLGSLANLETEAKSDLVSAINEAAKTSRSTSHRLPVLYLNGATSAMTSEKNEVGLQYNYIDPNDSSHRTGWLKAKWQGDSSVIFAEQYGKANYTLKFYHDALFGRKDKIEFGFDTKQSKWVAKANWIDAGHARNIVSNRLWADIVKCRHAAVPALLAKSPCYGAVNGFPISIYENQVYHGLYTLNIPKDDYTYGMDKDNPLHCVIGFCYQGGYCNFVCGASETPLTEGFTKSTYFETEIGTVSADIATGFNAMLKFVSNSSDEDFKANLDNYLDVESAIDYYLLMYFICSIDSLAKNIHLLTYDGGTKWYMQAYDMDETFGNVQGGAFKSPTARCPEDYQATGSRLWSRLEANFGRELYDRYQELRSSVLNLTYINDTIDYFVGLIPAEEYAADRALYTSLGNRTINHAEQMKEFVLNRSSYVDGEISGLIPPVPATSITLNRSSYTFDAKTPITLVATMLPEDNTDTVVWASSDESVATVDSNGLVTPVYAGTCTITATARSGNVSATCALTIPEDLYVDGLRVTLNLNHGTYGSGKAADKYYDSSNYIEIPDGVSVLATKSPILTDFAMSIYDSDKNIITGNVGNGTYVRYAIPDSLNAKFFAVQQKADKQTRRIVVTTSAIEDYRLSYSWLTDGATHQVDGTTSDAVFHSTDYIELTDDVVQTLNGFYVNNNTGRRFGLAVYDAEKTILGSTWGWANATARVSVGVHNSGIGAIAFFATSGKTDLRIAELAEVPKYIKVYSTTQENLNLYWI